MRKYCSIPCLLSMFLLAGFLALNNPTSEDFVRFIALQAGPEPEGVSALEMNEAMLIFTHQVSRTNLGIASLFAVPSQGEEALMLGVGRRFFVVRYAEDGHGVRSAHFLR